MVFPLGPSIQMPLYRHVVGGVCADCSNDTADESGADVAGIRNR